MKNPQLHIDQSIYFGLETFKKYKLISLGISFLYLIFFLFSIFNEYQFGPEANIPNGILYNSGTVLITIVTLYFSIAITKACLKTVDNKKLTFKDIYKTNFKLLLKVIVQTIFALILVCAAVIFIGGNLFGAYKLLMSGKLIISIIPVLLAIFGLAMSVWLAISFSLIKYVLIDTNGTVMDSFKKSYQLSVQQKFTIIGFNIAKCITLGLGFLLFGIGIIIAFPLTQFATAHFYRSLYSTAN